MTSRWSQVMVLCLVVVMCSPCGHLAAQEGPNRWGVGTDLGFASGTVNGTVFTPQLTVDYYFDPSFSVGPMVLWSREFYTDSCPRLFCARLTQIAIAGVARYRFQLPSVTFSPFMHIGIGSLSFHVPSLTLVPFAGLGLMYADVERGSGLERIDQNDISWYAPVGLTVEFPLIPQLAFASTFMLNLHEINLRPGLAEKDHMSVAVLFGLRWGP